MFFNFLRSLCIFDLSTSYRECTLDPKTALMMTIPLYTHRPAKFKFLQSINSIQMWRCGASNKVSDVRPFTDSIQTIVLQVNEDFV